ncbi:MAG: phosphatase PAP2 family protein [Negativicutes bacterium]|nr:phosphatase PAP2 family protein [Negativicutes bacterium]
MFLKRLIMVMALLLLAAAVAGVLRPERQVGEAPDVFSRGDIVVGQEQYIGKLLVVDGKAAVSGRVTRWLAVIGGDLAVNPGAEISGGVFVLGGELTIERGVNFAPAFRIVLTPGSPLILLMVWTLMAAALTVAAISVLLAWAFIRWLRRVDGYNRLLRVIPLSLRRWPGLFALVGLAVSGFLLAVFVHLARETIFFHEADFLDQVVIWLTRYYATPTLDKIMVVITYIGSGYAYVLLAPVSLASLFIWRRRREGVSLAVCLAGATLLNFLLKHLFERARPDTFRVVSESGYSFPSGHAMLSLCFYGMIAYIWSRRIPAAARRIMLYGLTAVLVLAVGLSRIYLGVHYPSDVLGGYLAGATWLAFCVALLWWWEAKK